MSRFGASLNLWLSGLPVLIALLFALAIVCLTTPVLFLAACYVCGLAVLLQAKLSLFRQGVWISFGPRRMSKSNRRRWVAAYGLIIATLAANLALLHTCA